MISNAALDFLRVLLETILVRRGLHDIERKFDCNISFPTIHIVILKSTGKDDLALLGGN